MEADPFDQPVRGDGEEDADFLLRLDSYEGPIDVLLDQARSQRVDLAQVSILALAEQYLAFVERARRLRLDLAAEYLVMAAWLALLKSRLLLPDERTSEEPSAAEMAEALALQLRRLEAVRAAAERLVARPRLGIAVFARGAPEGLGGTPRPVYEASLFELLQSYADIRRRTDRRAHHLRIEASRVHSVEDALERLRALLGTTVDWTELAHFLPEPDADPLVARSALASTFAASLELVKSGAAQLRQDRLFEEIYVKPVERRA
ncbi:MAG: segregation/condensation protein A [Rhodospirillaceae bacterium]|nr:segregation/condensation protein A [Rhodospirillaceae bacterium]